jgi:hypothetical protein
VAFAPHIYSTLATTLLSSIGLTLLLLLLLLLPGQTLGPKAEPLLTRMSRPLMAQALQLWQKELVPAVTLSPLQREVVCELAALKLQPVSEGLTPDGMFSVDVLLRYKGCKVALEVMGMEHYSCNQLLMPAEAQQQQVKGAAAGPCSSPEPQHVLLGPDQLRLRLLAARGYKLVTVSNYDREALRDEPGALRQLLQQKLQFAVVPSSSAGNVKSSAVPQSQARHNAAAAAGARPGTVVSDGLGMTQQLEQAEALEQPADSLQQLGRLLGQKGHSKRVQKRQQLLRRQHYMQQRQQVQAAGLEVLLQAAQLDSRLAVAQGGDGSSSSNSSSTTRRRRLPRGGQQQQLHSATAATAQQQDAATAGAGVFWSVDKEFDMALVLDDLLLPADVDGQL